MLVIGEKEQSAGTVSIRDRVDGDLEMFHDEVAKKKIRQVSTASAGLSDAGAKFGE